MTVSPMLPEYPRVRCDNCRRTYTLPPQPGGVIRGNCPRCGHERFSTRITASTQPPRQEE